MKRFGERSVARRDNGIIELFNVVRDDVSNEKVSLCVRMRINVTARNIESTGNERK